MADALGRPATGLHGPHIYRKELAQNAGHRLGADRGEDKDHDGDVDRGRRHRRIQLGVGDVADKGVAAGGVILPRRLPSETKALVAFIGTGLRWRRGPVMALTLTMSMADGAKSQAYTKRRGSSCAVSSGNTVLPTPQPTSRTLN